MMKKGIWKNNLPVVFVLVLGLMMSACSTPSAPQEQQEPQTESSQPSEEKAAYEPFKLTTYETEVEYTKVPQAVVSFNVHTTENLMALGLTDKIVGISYTNAEVLPQYKEAYDKIPVLSDKYPSLEVLMGAQPDFVYGRSSAFGEKGVTTVQGFVDNGIMPYVCKPTYTNGAKMEDVYEDFENLGKIFAIEEKAKEITDGMKERIAVVSEKVSKETPKTVFVYDSGEDQAYTAGNSLQSNIIELAGGKNVFDHLEKTWEKVNWEAVVEKNPDYIIVNDYGETKLEDKIAFLKKHPALQDMDAIKNDRFVAVELPSVFAGIRNADAVETIAKGLYPDLFQ